MSNDNVIPAVPIVPVPVIYTQSRQTKLGLATVTIKQEGDLFEATVTITYNDVIFKAEGIFSSSREAFHWAYGVKQETNDGWSGYQIHNGVLVETKPKKNMPPRTSTIVAALQSSIVDYQNFELSKSTGSAEDKISMSAVKSSPLLSEEDKITMASLFAKMGKVSQ